MTENLYRLSASREDEQSIERVLGVYEADLIAEIFAALNEAPAKGAAPGVSLWIERVEEER